MVEHKNISEPVTVSKNFNIVNIFEYWLKYRCLLFEQLYSQVLLAKHVIFKELSRKLIWTKYVRSGKDFY